MYNLVNSIAISRTIGSQWHEVDLSNASVYDVYSVYSKVYLILQNDALPNEVYVDLDSLRYEFSSYSGTMSELLIELGNRTLVTVDSIPSDTIKVAKYSDAIRSQYKIDVTKIGVVIPENYPESELHDLVITRPKYDTDLSLVHSHCLVSVNGYYHMTDTDGSKAYVNKGADTMRKSGSNHLGMLSFLDIGELTKVKLNPDNILGQTDTSPLSEKIIFSVEEELDDKSYILVLGGYLVFPSDNIFWRNGTHSFTLDLNKLPYLERLYESNNYLDLTDLELTEQTINPDAINIEEVWSDRVIKNYMTLSQSYLVIIDTPNILTNKIHLRHCSMPGMFTAYQDPVYPLMVGHGKVAEYWKVAEDGFWSVTVQDSFYRNYIISNQNSAILENVNNNLVPNKPFYHSRGYLLEISSYRT